MKDHERFAEQLLLAHAIPADGLRRLAGRGRGDDRLSQTSGLFVAGARLTEYDVGRAERRREAAPDEPDLDGVAHCDRYDTSDVPIHRDLEPLALEDADDRTDVRCRRECQERLNALA